MLARSSAEPLRREWINSDGNQLQLTHYFESPLNDAAQPQAFLVDFPAGTVSRPHFHPVDQFQLIVDGDAVIGKKEFKPVGLHYTDAFTPYGPFVANRDVKYFTMRPARSGGTLYMPESRAALAQRPGRTVQNHYDLDQVTRAGSPDAPPAADVRGDGLALCCASAMPGSRWTDPVKVSGGGRYYVVLAGTLLLRERSFPPWSCLHFAAGESPPAFDVAPGGPCAVAIVQFPIRDRQIVG